MGEERPLGDLAADGGDHPRALTNCGAALIVILILGFALLVTLAFVLLILILGERRSPHVVEEDAVENAKPMGSVHVLRRTDDEDAA